MFEGFVLHWRKVTVHPSRGRGSRRSVILHPQAQSVGGRVQKSTTRFRPQIPADLCTSGPARPHSSPPYFIGPPKKDKRRASAGAIRPRSYRPQIDFRAPLNGSEHIVLLCLCKAALNYSVCVRARGLRALACARAHVSLSRTLIGLDSLGKVTS